MRTEDHTMITSTVAAGVSEMAWCTGVITRLVPFETVILILSFHTLRSLCGLLPDDRFLQHWYSLCCLLGEGQVSAIKRNI